MVPPDDCARIRSTINPAQVNLDLDALTRMFAADSPTKNAEAIAF